MSITNNSPHAVTVIDVGVIRGDGRQSSITGEDGLKIRVEPRDSVFYRLGTTLSVKYAECEWPVVDGVGCMSAWQLITVFTQ